MNRKEEFCGRRLYLEYDDLNRLKLKRLLSKNVNYLITNKQITNKELLFIFKINNIWLYKFKNILKNRC